MNPRSVLAASMLFATLVLPAAALAATTHVRDTSGGVACHPANGGAVASFTRGNNVLTNNATTDQYVVCHLPMDDVLGSIYAPQNLTAYVSASAAGGTVTCVAQIGSYYLGVNSIDGSDAKTVLLGSNGAAGLAFDVSHLPRTEHIQVLTLNCKLPPGGKLGLIQWLQSQ